MSEFAALRESILAQMELGNVEVCFDEPWSPTPPSLQPLAPARSPANPSSSGTSPANTTASEARPPQASRPASVPPVVALSNAQPAVDMNSLLSGFAARPAEDDAAWERTRTLADLNQTLTHHPLYKELCDGPLVCGQGPEHAPFMLVFHSPGGADLLEGTVLSGAAGELLTRLLSSLKVDRKLCYSTYFFKGLAPNRLLPRQCAILRRMLQHEIALAKPQRIVVFGERAYQQLLDGKDFRKDAGAPLEFAGLPVTALVDPADMLDNKELKLLTWNTHIPRCGFFER